MYPPVIYSLAPSERRDVEDRDKPILQKAMEYTGLVGMMMMDKLVYVHERTKEGMGWAINTVELTMDNVKESITNHKNQMPELEEQVALLMDKMWGKDKTINRLEQVVNLHVDMLRIIQGNLDEQQVMLVAAIHRLQNLIEVEDNSDKSEVGSDKGTMWDDDEVPVPIPAPRGRGLLVEIQDEEEQMEVENVVDANPVLAYME